MKPSEMRDLSRRAILGRTALASGFHLEGCGAEGTYEDGGFKFIRILNGDRADNALNLRTEPIALRVSLGVY